MRTARRVIACILSLCAAAALWAQQPKPAEGSVDSSVTVMGRDDSVIAVPAPADVEPDLGLPPADLLLEETPDGAVESPIVPAVSPPVADISLPPRDAVLVPAAQRLTLQ